MTERQAGRLTNHSVLGLQTLPQVDDGRDVIGTRSGQRNDGHRLYVDVTVGQKVNQCLDNGGAFVLAFKWVKIGKNIIKIFNYVYDKGSLLVVIIFLYTCV